VAIDRLARSVYGDTISGEPWKAQLLCEGPPPPSLINEELDRNLSYQLWCIQRAAGGESFPEPWNLTHLDSSHDMRGWAQRILFIVPAAHVPAAHVVPGVVRDNDTKPLFPILFVGVAAQNVYPDSHRLDITGTPGPKTTGDHRVVLGALSTSFRLDTILQSRFDPEQDHHNPFQWPNQRTPVIKFSDTHPADACSQRVSQATRQ